ncbi:hypothetical protein HRR83_000183 [Exophiala dermatitidis]|uniref:Uncharacterized protein n=1 Tax=Exophiala dermatitidis TaxID=5970 RepID=A0AAN6F3N9_EXODE|nr:hypothetical protein HRR73_002719 [Exophiala dermatitidis]KAJ4527430.1 hypothetical protein HRR74_000184 [Exophiala dermatitidis]KAJ4530995.1 hypothetical protein HRR76_008681 [Exophiala dermatitidis]KAJ4558163.1 hypothetical protein HRR77_000183 [Exophiala dermatitidis]KAJ4581805.1 hypothetical protein HRR79_000812 [Exophiala dermatitidis]
MPVPVLPVCHAQLTDYWHDDRVTCSCFFTRKRNAGRSAGFVYINRHLSQLQHNLFFSSSNNLCNSSIRQTNQPIQSNPIQLFKQTLANMSNYQPTEHDGLRKDGEPDQRVGTGEFAHGKVDPHEAGKQGGHSSGGSGSSGSGGSDNNQGSANLGGDGLRKDGQPDQRLKQNQ